MKNLLNVILAVGVALTLVGPEAAFAAPRQERAVCDGSEGAIYALVAVGGTEYTSASSLALDFVGSTDRAIKRGGPPKNPSFPGFGANNAQKLCRTRANGGAWNVTDDRFYVSGASQDMQYPIFFDRSKSYGVRIGAEMWAIVPSGENAVSHGTRFEVVQVLTGDSVTCKLSDGNWYAKVCLCERSDCTLNS